LSVTNISGRPWRFIDFLRNFRADLRSRRLCNITFQHLTFIIIGAPKIMRLAVELHEYLVQMPLPVRISPHSIDPVFTDFCREHRAKSVPPVPHRFVADLDPSLVQQVFDVSERKREPNVEHRRQANDLRARLEIAKWGTFCHPTTLRNRPARLKSVFLLTLPTDAVALSCRSLS
jgi:hypothetical protein